MKKTSYLFHLGEMRGIFMSTLPGVFQAQKKDGSIYYRASITCKSKHISLGSYPTEDIAFQCYEEATRLFRSKELTINDYYIESPLSFSRWVSLINFRDNGIYCKTPIYIYSNYFHYYFSPEDLLKFDVDDLFYYSKHTIQRRGGHLFVAEYGTQFNILSRYGIKNFAVMDRDYRFVNGDPTDFRYRNIEVINKYHGVRRQFERGIPMYSAKIHINGDYQIGLYSTEAEAAVAYNKAASILQANGMNKAFPKNYVIELSETEYTTMYNQISISPKIKSFSENTNFIH